MEIKQMSIYDYLGAEELGYFGTKSQELPPSETVAQVDEAQVDIYGAMSQQLSKDVEDMILGDVPSSALDAKESTEDTDSTLFSVGDKFKVVSASSLYDTDIDPESYYYLLDYQDKTLEINSIGDRFVVTVGGQIFNFNEVIKI